MEDLSQSLSKELETYRLALDSPLGLHEYAVEFAKNIRGFFLPSQKSPKISELINWIEVWTTEAGRRPLDSVSVGSFTYTVKDLELIQAKLYELSREGKDTISEHWPGPDKPRLEGRTSMWWDEFYTEQQLLERAKAIFDGALRIYNDIVGRWFPAFNRRHQMTYMLPLRLEGILVPGGNPNRPEWHRASLMWWPRVISSDEESNVLFELGSWDQISGDATNDKLQTAREEFLDERGRFRHSTQIFRGSESRPATKIAYRWLTSDLQDLEWL